LIGCQLSTRYADAATGERAPPPAPLVLIAQDETGYRNLMKLNSCLYLRPEAEALHVTLPEIEEHAPGVICLTGGADGRRGRRLGAGHRPGAAALAQTLHASFGDRLYVEWQRHPGAGPVPEAERASERGLVEIAYAQGLPLVATNDVHFPTPD